MDVIIRNWKLSDAKNLSEALSNLNVQNNLRDGLPYPYTESDAINYITDMLAADGNNTFAFAIQYQGIVVGSIGAFRQNNIHCKTAELGYYVSEIYWGKGIATQAVKMICDFIFKNTDIIRIFAEPFAHNAPSCKVLERAGFQYEGTLRSNALKCGKVMDMKMYSIIRN